jgi:hypothetical protein
MPATNPVEFYLAGDFVKERLQEEQRYLDSITGHPNSFPAEAGLLPAAKVIGRTAMTFFVWSPGVMFIRAVGIDKPRY